MSQHGTPPKLNRQRRQSPVRGDWVRLEPLKRQILPELDTIPVPWKCEGEWPFTARVYWDAWKISPVTAKWAPDDIALAIDSICGHAINAHLGGGGQSAEFRIRMESLGLTPKGRVDRRWLLPDESEPPEDGEVVPLHAVEEPERVRPEAI